MKMKIPTSGSGNGYYGHENSVIAYLENVEPETEAPSNAENDFSEYMWMENEEEFDKQVLQQLEEEELVEECLEAMLEEERQHERNQSSTAWANACSSADNNGAELCQQLIGLRVNDDIANKSNLNPNAAEFVPGIKKSSPPEISAKSSWSTVPAACSSAANQCPPADGDDDSSSSISSCSSLSQSFSSSDSTDSRD